MLDGALALAVPTKFGQSLQATPSDKNSVTWKSFNADESIWFSATFDLNTLSVLSSKASESKTSDRLSEILKVAKHLNPDFLKSGVLVETHLDFPRNWGLGTSSTLINNIANWAQVDAFELLALTFGGSGYDIACAQHDTAITYQNIDKTPIVNKVEFRPSFSDHLFFVHLNKKQDSRQGIAHYTSKKGTIDGAISEINSITKQVIGCQSLADFETLINKHETIVSNILEVPTVQQRLFNDYHGAIKSLGAWGGDFILVTGTPNDKDYFIQKGYNTILDYNNMVV